MLMSGIVQQSVAQIAWFHYIVLRLKSRDASRLYWFPYSGPPQVIRVRAKMGGGENESCKGWQKGNGE